MATGITAGRRRRSKYRNQENPAETWAERGLNHDGLKQHVMRSIVGGRRTWKEITAVVRSGTSDWKVQARRRQL